MKGLKTLVLATAMAVSMVAGCCSSFAAETVSDESVVIALSAEPTCLLNCIIAGSANSAPGYMIYDSLVRYNSETGEVEPDLAVSWEMLDDVTWQFKLREGVVDQNGNPLTADDVLYTFKIGTEGGLSFYTRNFDIEKFEVIDDTTINIVTTSFQPDLITMLCVACYGITTEEGVNDAGGVDAACVNPVGGSGPYNFVEWVSGDHITLERNENYWGEKAYFKTVTLRFVSDATTRLLGLQSGEYDVVASVNSEQVSSVEANPDLTLVSDSTLSGNFLLFNCATEGLDNVLVRQAIAYAIDRNVILTAAMLGYGELTQSTLSTMNPAYVENPNYLFDTQNIEKAKELMAEAGYADGGLTLTYRYDAGTTGEKIGVMLQGWLKEIGIDVQLSVWTDSTTDQAAGNWDIQLNSAGAYMLERAYNCLITGSGEYLTNGWSAWCNKEFDAAVEKIKEDRITDMGERGAALADAFFIAEEECPIIGLYNTVAFAGVRNGITGLRVSIQGEYTFEKITK